MAKKSSVIKKLALTGSVGILTAYIASQVGQAIKRYDLKEDEFTSEHFIYQKDNTPKNPRSKSQLGYDFTIIDKATEKKLGTCRLLLGQEEESYFDGHIKVDVPKIVSEQNKEIYLAMIKVAKEHTMTALYFTCDPKDKEQASFYESLGAKYYREIKILPDNPRYQKKRKSSLQYRISFVEEKKN